MDRRGFFSSLLPKAKKESNVIRPPYLAKSFDECGESCNFECQSVCEEQIIRVIDNKPMLDFSKKGCTFCEKCGIECPQKVLDIEVSNQKVIKARFEIDVLKCLSWNKTICFSCKDVCLEKSIKFYGMFNPEILQNCINCGFCVGVCPSEAIKYKGIS